jgi:hypothetical protein
VGERRAQALGQREIEYDVIDTQVFAEDGGPSLAERANKVRFKGKRLQLRKADKQRLPGWNQVRARLRGDLPDEQAPPMLFFLMHCEDAIRTLAALQHDDVESKFEDAETEGEDHPPDGIRYGCMSRPRKLPDPEDRFQAPTKKRNDGMADDRGLEGPEDSRLVEAPAGLTPLELRAGEEARRKIVEHLGKNPVLRMDELVEMKDLRPRLEKEMRLPGDTRGSRTASTSSRSTARCAATGSRAACSRASASWCRASGLRARIALRRRTGCTTTLEIAREYFDELNRSIVVASPWMRATCRSTPAAGAASSCPASRTSRPTRS